MSRKILT